MKLTAEWLASKSACIDGVKWWENCGEVEAVPILKKLIADKKLPWANWLIVRVMDYKLYVSYAVFAAEQVLGIYEKKHPKDKRPRQAIEAAKKCIKNPSKENKNAADAAADAYAYAAADAAAAYAAAYAAYAAATATACAAAAAAATACAAADADAMRIKILKYGIKLLEE